MKITTEDEERKLPYLDTVIGVDTYNQIYFHWYQKECSWKRILDFHSDHPIRMKENVVRQSIINALRITSPIYWDHTINLISTTLRNSNYSKKFIKSEIMAVRQSFGTISTTSEWGNTDPSINIIKLTENHYNKIKKLERKGMNSSRFK